MNCTAKKLLQKYPQTVTTLTSILFLLIIHILLNLYRYTLFHCALQILYFLQIEDLWQACLEQVCRCQFFQQHSLNVYHILVILTLFKTLLLLFYYYIMVICN